MNAITLPPDLERFADEAVAAGRFGSVDEVVRAAMSLLRHSDAEIEAFAASLDAAEAEGERLGFRPLDAVMRDVDTLIEDVTRTRR